MTRSEIAYSILETIRQGSIVDDERLDIRLIESFIPIKRAEYLEESLKKNIPASENSIQEYTADINRIDFGSYTGTVTTASVPNPINTKFGLALVEIASTDFNQYPFTIVNSSHFRFAGNGRFNRDNIFVCYENNTLFFKSGDTTFNTLEQCIIRGVFEYPENVPGFDVENDDYPVDVQGIDYIKESIFRMDIRMFMAGITDEISDSSGEIKQ